ncbi:Nuclear hormone receptor family member nhr-64 [Aphelenchoides bicaudatus]|nr:Nuclear hormone receptor family member nhr-64 [Aphelenchoides bicaudatus]
MPVPRSFDRTVKQARSYVCSRGKRCRVDFGGHKRTCRYCRFARCLSVGMNIGSVLTRHYEDADPLAITPSGSGNGGPGDLNFGTTLRQLVDAFGSTFVNRLHAKSKNYTYNGKLVDKSTDGLLLTIHACFAEFDVMLRYLKQTKINSYLENDQQFIALAGRLFYNWFFINGCWSTLRNSGHHQNTVYFTDESCVELTTTSEQQYVKSLEALKNPDSVAKSLIELHNSALATSIKFHSTGIDVNDYAFICQIIALQSGINLYPWNKELRTQLSNVFKAACNHYDQNYKDVAIKFGNLILLINEAQQFIKEFEEWVVFLTLNGCPSALETILSSWKF